MDDNPVVQKVREKYGDEVAEKLIEKLNSSGGMPTPSQSINIDMKTVFVVLATCALLVGKKPYEVDTEELVQTAFRLAERLFNPTGELDQ